MAGVVAVDAMAQERGSKKKVEASVFQVPAAGRETGGAALILDAGVGGGREKRGLFRNGRLFGCRVASFPRFLLSRGDLLKQCLRLSSLTRESGKLKRCRRGLILSAALVVFRVSCLPPQQ